jgi:hypothetical protein
MVSVERLVLCRADDTAWLVARRFSNALLSTSKSQEYRTEYGTEHDASKYLNMHGEVAIFVPICKEHADAVK